MQPPQKKILIVKFGALGDVVMSTSLIDQIQKFHSGDQVHLLTSPPFEDLFHNWKDLEITSLSRKGLLSTLKMIGWLRKQGFDRVYDLQSNDRSRFVLAFSGIKERVGNHPAIPYNISPENKYIGDTHIFERMNLLLASAGIPAADPLPVLPCSREDEKTVLDWLEKNGLIDKKFVLLHAGASPEHPEKCWPYYLPLAKELNKRGLVPVWLGSDNEKENNRSCSSVVGIDATNVFSLTQISLLGHDTAFSLTNDSGPMHILSASRRPVFAFFGATNWRRNHALGQMKYVITLQPDGVIGKQLRNPDYALKNISVEFVMDRLKKEGLINA